MEKSRIEKLDPAMGQTVAGDDLVWFPGERLELSGRLWDHGVTPFSRFPARARELLRPQVWECGQHSAGLSLNFTTDSSVISARWECEGSMNHMARTGVCGLDLYAFHDGAFRWVGIGRPDEERSQSCRLAGGLAPGMRRYRLYLPLYSRLDRLAIGIEEGASISPDADRGTPVVVYGTSIVQGGCASRPGMGYTAICERMTGVPWVNLGFSGNGTMDAAMFQLIAERESLAIVIDCLPNMNAPDIVERLTRGVSIIRDHRPETPILILDHIMYAQTYLVEELRLRIDEKNRLQREAFAALTRDGVEGLHYLPTAGFTGDDSEGSVDGSHLTDLGFQRMAERLAPVVSKIIAHSQSGRSR